MGVSEHSWAGNGKEENKNKNKKKKKQLKMIILSNNGTKTCKNSNKSSVL